LPHLIDNKQPRPRPWRGEAAALVLLLVALSGCGSAKTHPRADQTASAAHRAHHSMGNPNKQTGRVGTQESLGGVPVPFAHQEFRVVNMFLGNRGPYYAVDVYAGYAPQTPQRGELRVIWMDNRIGTPDDGLSGTFVPPGRLGRIRVLSVRGDNVTFVSKRGRCTFNLGTHRFAVVH
jgi:uncharacterized protein YceK